MTATIIRHTQTRVGFAVVVTETGPDFTATVQRYGVGEDGVHLVLQSQHVYSTEARALADFDAIGYYTEEEAS